MFDHQCDSLSNGIAVLNMSMYLGFNQAFYMIATLFSVTSLFSIHVILEYSFVYWLTSQKKLWRRALFRSHQRPQWGFHSDLRYFDCDFPQWRSRFLEWNQSLWSDFPGFDILHPFDDVRWAIFRCILQVLPENLIEKSLMGQQRLQCSSGLIFGSLLPRSGSLLQTLPPFGIHLHLPHFHPQCISSL